VAAHSSDLEAAAQAGLQTAFIARPDEYGLGLGETKAITKVDHEALDLLDLARQLQKGQL
jgi:2-haloacid dehalogenase